jgi:hypothetical protein
LDLSQKTITVNQTIDLCQGSALFARRKESRLDQRITFSEDETVSSEWNIDREGVGDYDAISIFLLIEADVLDCNCFKLKYTLSNPGAQQFINSVRLVLTAWRRVLA